MISLELLKQRLDTFNEEQLEQIADFMERLQSTETDDTPDTQILTDFQQAWHEAMSGQTVPVAQIWDDLENV